MRGRECDGKVTCKNKRMEKIIRRKMVRMEKVNLASPPCINITTGTVHTGQCRISKQGGCPFH